MPARFSWIDQQFVQAHHLDRIDVCASALYLFLVTVADARGLSWYGDESIARRLSIDTARVRQARAALVQADLLAFANGVYQVLSLSRGKERAQASVVSLVCSAPSTPPTTPSLSPLTAPVPTRETPPPVPTDRATARQHLALLHAILEKRT